MACCGCCEDDGDDSFYDFDDVTPNDDKRRDDPRPPVIVESDSDDDDDDEDSPADEYYVDDPHNSGLKHWTVDDRRKKRPKADVRPPVLIHGEEWTDSEFPLPVAIREFREEKLHWKRPHEIVRNPVLFSDGASRFDIKQRGFGTCWFLSMVANLADKPSLRKKVISESSYTPKGDGVCHCRLWRFGDWEDVYMDDHLPVYRYRNNVYDFYGAMSGTNANEVWVSLLEKSLARLHGSYNVVSDTGGYPCDAYITLTGGVAEVVNLFRRKPRPLYNRISNALRSGALITCAVPSKNDGVKGLVGGHAYSLTGSAVVTLNNGENVPLLRIRNPHGKTEWNGRWSDRSDDWSSVREGRRLVKDKDDGEFWMHMEDFMDYFMQTTICSLTPDFDIDGRSDALNHVLRIYGVWRGRSNAGEGRSLMDRLKNTKFEFTVPSEGETEEGFVPVVVQLIQHSRHLNYEHIRCDLYMIVEDAEDRMYVRKMEDTEDKDHFFPSLQCAFRFRLRPGRYFAVPVTYNPRVRKDFLIRVFAPCPLRNYKRISQGKMMKLIR